MFLDSNDCRWFQSKHKKVNDIIDIIQSEGKVCFSKHTVKSMTNKIEELLELPATLEEGKIQITLDNGRKIYKSTSSLSECPLCKNNSVRAKELEEGGGIKCIKCDYWECF